MTPERAPERSTSSESTAELAAIARERLDQLRDNPDRHEADQQHKLEQARRAIDRHNEQPQPTREREHGMTHMAPHRNPFINYMHTMASMRRRLSPASRRFSDVIHHPVVEQVSEAMEKTVMRPSVALGATSTALLVASILYFMARKYGFGLSGSEVIVAIVLGGIFGAVTELLFYPFKRKR